MRDNAGLVSTNAGKIREWQFWLKGSKSVEKLKFQRESALLTIWDRIMNMKRYLSSLQILFLLYKGISWTQAYGLVWLVMTSIPKVSSKKMFVDFVYWFLMWLNFCIRWVEKLCWTHKSCRVGQWFWSAILSQVSLDWPII